MKKIYSLLFAGSIVVASAGTSNALPVDLSTFSVIENQPGSVTESGGAVDFTESMLDAALYFYDDNFYIDPSATTLSFDYNFILGQSDVGDYLQFNVNYIEEWHVDVTSSGSVAFDLTTYQGSTISLDWALIWSSDCDAGTTASVYNIDIATAPVPEPATMLLFGTGIAGLYVSRRKKKLLNIKK